jgi:hypothetical protein
MSTSRTYRAGESIEDFCRACKTDRMHMVIASDASGWPLRVTCGYCRSEHRYRGGPRVEPSSSPFQFDQDTRPSDPGDRPEPRRSMRAGEPFPTVSDRERSAPPIMLPDGSTDDLELLLRRIIREETGITPVSPAEKWRGGQLVLRPGAPGVQEKSWPIETFFHKVVMLRNRLRTLEQQLNGSDLPEDLKVKLQGYVSGCYGTLTSFNVLFADEADQFKGSGE